MYESSALLLALARLYLHMCRLDRAFAACLQNHMCLHISFQYFWLFSKSVCVCVGGGGQVATQNIFIDEDEHDKTNNLTLSTPSKDSKQPPNNLTCWFCYTLLASSQFLLSDKFVA